MASWTPSSYAPKPSTRPLITNSYGETNPQRGSLVGLVWKQRESRGVLEHSIAAGTWMGFWGDWVDAICCWVAGQALLK